MNRIVMERLVDAEEEVVPTLFKPVQFGIIKKLLVGKRLSENEKRYLRGKMRKKLEVVEKLASGGVAKEGEVFLNSLGSYYVTGFEALKHNGFGWYFNTKVIEVMNTKLKGKLRVGGKTFKLIRVKSIKNSDYRLDKETGMKYATNEQILKDIKAAKNRYALLVWKQMLSRYGKLFVRNYGKFKAFVRKPKTINFSEYGV